MAIQKTRKINMYKFVDTGKESSGGPKRGKDKELVRVVNLNTNCLNNLGGVLNGIVTTVQELKNIEVDLLENRRKRLKQIDTAPTPSGTPKATKSFLKKFSNLKTPGFLDSIMKFLSSIFKLMVVMPILKWLSDPKNKKKIKATLIKLHTIFKAIASFISSQVVGMIDDLYDLLRDDSDPWTKIKSFTKIWLRFAGAFLAIRYLTQPWKIISDVRKVFMLFDRRGKTVKRQLLRRKGRLMMTGGRARKWFLGGFIGGAALWAAMEFLFPQKTADGTIEAQMDKEGKLPGDKGYDESTAGFFKKDGDGDAEKELNRAADRSKSIRDYGEDLTNDGNYSKINVGEYEDGNGIPLKDQAQLPDKQKEKADQMNKKNWWQKLTDLPGNITKSMDDSKDKNDNILADMLGITAAKKKADDTMAEMSRKMQSDLEGKEGDKVGAITSILNALVPGQMNKVREVTNKGVDALNSVQSQFEDMKPKKSFWDDLKTGWGLFGGKKNSILGGDVNPMGSGIISGPNSGFPVSMHPALPPSFIGHGTEYVATKGDGSGFVIPLDNFATRRDPGIVSRSIHRARQLGFNLSELGLKKFERGGGFGPALYHPTNNKINSFRGISDKSLTTQFGSKLGKDWKKKGVKGSSDELFQKLILAEAKGEGMAGMALVARSVLNRQNIIDETGNPGTFMSKSGSLKDIISAPGQYSPMTDGSIGRKYSGAELEVAARAIEIAKSHSRLKGLLANQIEDPQQIAKLMSATGFRNYSSAFYDKSQDVNEVKFGNHTFNTAGNKEMRFGLHGDRKHNTLMDKLLNPDGLNQKDKKELGRAGSAYTKKTGQTGAQLFGGIFGGAKDMMGGEGGKPGGIFSMLTNVFGASSDGKKQGKKAGGSNVNKSKSKKNDEMKIQRATDERNKARKEINARTTGIVAATTAAVDQSNRQTRQYISAANQSISQILTNSKGVAPGQASSAPGPGGVFGALLKTTAAVLNSFNNPLR